MANSHESLDPVDHLLAEGEELDDAVYPELYNLSSRFLFRFLPRPAQPMAPEFLYLPMPQRDSDRSGERRLSIIGLMAQWNLAWESAQLRQQMFGDDLAKYARGIRLRDDVNVFLLPATKSCIEAFVPIYMLLPRSTMERFGLPTLRRMTWPHSLLFNAAEAVLPGDIERRLAAAFASVIWPFLVSGSPQRAFRRDDPLVLLAHNLEFWLPHVFAVLQERLRALDLVEFEDAKETKILAKIREEIPEDVWVDRCRMGGPVWMGRDDAQDALGEVVATADRHGRLSAIIDAVRSNRVEEDFSARWSFAREDFERKLHNKRAKVRVRFVELEQAETVVGPHSDITDSLLWQDFLALLNRKERQVVVCLTRGTTKLAAIAAELGYANHSPVSKALARIRQKARKLLQ